MISLSPDPFWLKAASGQQGSKALSCFRASPLWLLAIKSWVREGREWRNTYFPLFFPLGFRTTTNDVWWEPMFCNLPLWHPDEGAGCTIDLFFLSDRRHCVVWVYSLEPPWWPGPERGFSKSPFLHLPRSCCVTLSRGKQNPLHRMLRVSALGMHYKSFALKAASTFQPFPS